jgi:hypothetical protein
VNAEPRWDGDRTGRGIGDAAGFADAATELVAAMREPEWVAEEPEAHLLPHLETACRELPLKLESTAIADDGTFDIELEWHGDGESVGQVRSAVYALLGSVAETATYIRQRRVDGALVFDVVTGMIGDDIAFAPHGHALRLFVDLEAGN